MTREKSDAASKPEAKPKGATPMETDHNYQTSTASSKRKSPNTPTKMPTPPNKVVVSQVNESADSALVEAIKELTNKMDSFGVQLTENSMKLSQNSIMIANIAKLADINAENIKECNTKLSALEKTVPTLSQEFLELKERVLEQERYRRRWNLKMHGLKEKNDENTRNEVISILAKIAPQYASSLGNIVDTVHRLGRKKEGETRQIIIQFGLRQHRDFFWEVTKPKHGNICKELGIRFKEDFCKEDRAARAAVWPKMERAKAARKVVYYRGAVGYIEGVRVTPD